MKILHTARLKTMKTTTAWGRRLTLFRHKSAISIPISTASKKVAKYHIYTIAL